MAQPLSLLLCLIIQVKDDYTVTSELHNTFECKLIMVLPIVLRLTSVFRNVMRHINYRVSSLFAVISISWLSLLTVTRLTVSRAKIRMVEHVHCSYQGL